MHFGRVVFCAVVSIILQLTQRAKAMYNLSIQEGGVSMKRVKLMLPVLAAVVLVGGAVWLFFTPPHQRQ